MAVKVVIFIFLMFSSLALGSSSIDLGEIEIQGHVLNLDSVLVSLESEKQIVFSEWLALEKKLQREALIQELVLESKRLSK